MSIDNNDNCDIKIGCYDVALELTKILYSNANKITVSENEIINSYKYFKKELDKSNET